MEKRTFIDVLPEILKNTKTNNAVVNSSKRNVKSSTYSKGSVNAPTLKTLGVGISVVREMYFLFSRNLIGTLRDENMNSKKMKKSIIAIASKDTVNGQLNNIDMFLRNKILNKEMKDISDKYINIMKSGEKIRVKENGRYRELQKAETYDYFRKWSNISGIDRVYIENYFMIGSDILYSIGNLYLQTKDKKNLIPSLLAMGLGVGVNTILRKKVNEHSKEVREEKKELNKKLFKDIQEGLTIEPMSDEDLKYIGKRISEDYKEVSQHNNKTTRIKIKDAQKLSTIITVITGVMAYEQVKDKGNFTLRALMETMEILSKYTKEHEIITILATHKINLVEEYADKRYHFDENSLLNEVPCSKNLKKSESTLEL